MIDQISETALLEVSRTQRRAFDATFFSDRALKAIEGREPLEQLGMLREYVEQAERDKLDGYGPPEDDINIVRRRYIRIASEVYRGVHS
jgi:hypothetical protein